MWFILQHFFPIGLVWILITIFTGSRDEDQSYREALICTCGLAAISMIFSWFLPEQFALLRYPIQVIALFFLVERVCESSRATTWRIIIWYVVISLIYLLAVNVITDFLRQPVEFQAP